jgi:hypothetical protein
MKLKRRILLEKVDRLEKLSKAERKRALSDPDHLVSIGENSALKDIEELYPRTPSWDSMRQKVLERASRLKARSRRRRLITGGAWPWYARWALALVMLAAVWVMATLLPRDRPSPYEQLATSGQRVVVHYADSKNLFGHVFRP